MAGIYDWADDEAGALAPPPAAIELRIVGGTGMFERTDDDGTAISKIDPCEAGTCGHPGCWQNDALIGTPADLGGMAPTGDDMPMLDTRPSLAEGQTMLGWVAQLDITAALDSTEAALDILRAVRAAKPALAAAEREAEKFVADTLPSGTSDLPGYGPVTVGWSAQRSQWDRSGLVAKTAAVIADRMGYPVQYIRQAIDEFLSFTTPSSWKVTALQAIGLDPDEYCSTRWKATVTVVKDKG